VVRVLETAVPRRSAYPLPAATDADSAAFGVARYRLAPNDTFSLELSSRDPGGLVPTMTLLQRLDREVQSHYELVVTAVDGGRPALSGTLSVSVVVVDANDNPPSFDRRVYNVSVLETVGPSQPLVRVHAADPDDGLNGALRYELSAASRKQHAGLFSVNNVTGDVRLARRLGADYSDLYQLTVVAFDQARSRSLTR